MGTEQGSDMLYSIRLPSEQYFTLLKSRVEKKLGDYVLGVSFS